MADRLANDKPPAPDAEAARAIDLGECRRPWRLAKALPRWGQNRSAAATEPGLGGLSDTLNMRDAIRGAPVREKHCDFDGTLKDYPTRGAADNYTYFERTTLEAKPERRRHSGVGELESRCLEYDGLAEYRQSNEARIVGNSQSES